ncbi:unnamed protein product [Cuscuta europaea]|uniref:F-box domain-containing protein n=1 Tax=Cuscuta europaea TaxID=41803 RepID=A0A9P1ENC7_CUSEU|nr:unnamed protein product [Cuscuta europaea]
MDRISQLPAGILDHIMGILPIQEAAKTAVLSTVWRDIWYSLSQLCFDHHFFCYMDRKYRGARKSVRRSCGLHVINNILLQHSGSIRKLVICFSNAARLGAKSPSYDMNQWFLIVTQKGIEEIHLRLAHNAYQLPDCIFSCSTLKRLHLDGFCIEPFTVPCKLPNVTSLCFEYVDFAPTSPSNYALDVPVLENLSFKNCVNMSQFNFMATNFHSLTIETNTFCAWRTFLPVNMNLTCICNLNLTDSSLQYLVEELDRRLKRGLPLQLNVDYLKLSDHYCQIADRTSAFVRLLRLCPKLCKLDIRFWFVEACNTMDDAMVNALEELRSVAQAHNKLLALKLSSVNRLGFKMIYIEELLASLPALEKVVIISPFDIFDCKEKYEFRKQVLNLPRASVKAKIVFV